MEGEAVVLSVSDAGPGFPEDDANPDGLGLAGLRDRVEALGGTFEMRSPVGGGAELRMTLVPGQTGS